MVIVRPFKGLRPRKDLADCVSSPPYDVLDSEEARVIVNKNSQSFLRVIKPEVDFDADVDIYSDEVYQKGAANLRTLYETGTLVEDPKPMFYFYRQVMDGHSQYGLVATVSAEDYEAGKIKKHEFTRPDKEEDRVRHIMTQKAQCGPVFLTYPDIRAINDLQKRVCDDAGAEVDFTSEDGIRHTLWLVDGDEDVKLIQQTFSNAEYLYVADGHHRSAAGTIAARKMRGKNSSHTGSEDYNFFLAVIFPKSHMKIMAYNRVVTDLNGQSPEDFLTEVAGRFTITPGLNPIPTGTHSYSMYLDGQWFGLEPNQGTFPPNDPVKSLDASILQENLLDPVLDIQDPRTSKRIKFVGGIRGTEELERLVDSGKFAVAFSLFPTSIEELIRVADSGNVMPPKSTWFEPKLRSGLIIHLIE